MSMSNLIKVNCPICQTSSDKEVYRVSGLPIVKCESCGLLYYNPNVNQSIHKAFVNDEDYYIAPEYQKLRASKEYNFQVYLSHLKSAEVKGYPDWLEPEHLKAKTSWGRRILGWFMEAAQGKELKMDSVLEVGGGTGHMLKDFKKFGGFKYVVSQEISEWASKTGESLLPEIVFKLGEVYDIEFEEKFDCVLMWDSFEHIQYPRQLLSKLKDITNEHALIVIHTPNADYAKEDWYLWSSNQHCFFYNKETLSKLLMMFGFKIIQEKPSPEADEMVLIYQKI